MTCETSASVVIAVLKPGYITQADALPLHPLLPLCTYALDLGGQRRKRYLRFRQADWIDDLRIVPDLYAVTLPATLSALPVQQDTLLCGSSAARV
jgi:hypothetical protein